MELFRISSAKYAHSLTASGVENRWNESGQFVIYAGGSRSLVSLEMVVHRSYIRPTQPYQMMVIHLADNDKLIKHVSSEQLPEDWRNISAYAKLQSIGSSWYKDKTSLVLKVPSAVVPQECNYIINTSHPEFKKYVKLIAQEPYIWDQRLL